MKSNYHVKLHLKQLIYGVNILKTPLQAEVFTQMTVNILKENSITMASKGRSAARP